MPLTDDDLVAVCVAHPNASVDDLAALLGTDVGAFARRRIDPLISARIDAAAWRKAFNPVLDQLVRNLPRVVAVVEHVRDDTTASPRDRAAAAKMLVQMATDLTEKRMGLDRHEQTLAALRLHLGGPAAHPPAAHPPAELPPAELPTAHPLTAHPPVEQMAPAVAAKLLDMLPASWRETGVIPEAV